MTYSEKSQFAIDSHYSIISSTMVEKVNSACCTKVSACCTEIPRVAPKFRMPYTGVSWMFGIFTIFLLIKTHGSVPTVMWHQHLSRMKNCAWRNIRNHLYYLLFHYQFLLMEYIYFLYDCVWKVSRAIPDYNFITNNVVWVNRLTKVPLL